MRGTAGAFCSPDANRDKVALISDGTGIVGLGDWAEQLIAESTGKEGRGILPVVVETPEDSGDEYNRMTEEALTRGLEGLPPAESPGSQRSGY